MTVDDATLLSFTRPRCPVDASARPSGSRPHLPDPVPTDTLDDALPLFRAQCLSRGSFPVFNLV